METPIPPARGFSPAGGLLSTDTIGQSFNCDIVGQLRISRFYSGLQQFPGLSLGPYLDICCPAAFYAASFAASASPYLYEHSLNILNKCSNTGINSANADQRGFGKLVFRQECEYPLVGVIKRAHHSPTTAFYRPGPCPSMVCFVLGDSVRSFSSPWE